MNDLIFLFFLKPCEFFRPYTAQSLVCSCVWSPLLQACWTGSIPHPTALYQGHRKQRYGDSSVMNKITIRFLRVLKLIQYNVYGTWNSNSSANILLMFETTKIVGKLTGKYDMNQRWSESFLYWNYQMNFTYSQNGPYPKTGLFT